MPVVRPRPTLFQDIRCSVNVVHNCNDNHCELQSTHQIQQENEGTQRFAKRVSHKNPDELILNCGQMRSARLISALYPPIPPTNHQELTRESAKKLWAKKHRGARARNEDAA
ncbi:uncharacterized protein SCHCODRAFT_02524774, partial [Schizophyllum commune H4-8]|uniref:uncharacterized protein n=1 Tax=Schizophyllum commune (strain H4-8 / FGSC 9210) TaxID=578458 RepID=UPI002160F237